MLSGSAIRLMASATLAEEKSSRTIANPRVQNRKIAAIKSANPENPGGIFLGDQKQTLQRPQKGQPPKSCRQGGLFLPRQMAAYSGGRSLSYLGSPGGPRRLWRTHPFDVYAKL